MDGAVIALVVGASCEGALAACAGAGSLCADVDSAGVEVIACDDGVALGSEEVGATVVDASVDGAAAGSRVTLRSLRAEAVVLLVEREARLGAFALGAATASTSFSFTTLLDLAGGVDGAVDSIVALGALVMVDAAGACASVAVELPVVLESATPGVVGATDALCAGFVAMGTDSTWRSNTNAPAITTATIAPNAIPKCLTRFSVRDVIHLGMRDRPHSCGITG